MGMTPIWFLLYFLFKPDFSGVTWQGLLLSIPAMVLGFTVGFLLSAAITSLAFWTTRVYSIHEFYYALILLFSGQFVPLPLMPKLIQDVAQYLPFQLLIYFPIQLILGKLSSFQIIQGFAVGAIWLAISIALFNRVWREGTKRYSAVGA
jgi:ABC-2 type transport system permease protein